MNRGRFRWTWPAFPGPVFRRELGSAARGRWFYLYRALAAGALAAYVGSSVPAAEMMLEAGVWSPGRVAEAATRAFRMFEASQFFLVLALAPLLVAGSVADEKARGTLGLLLAGRLGSAEIVADKLAARLLTVLVLVVAGLPVLALIGLLGGVDPGELLVVYALTLSSAWFSASLSMLVSVHARSATGAVVGAYVASFGWLVLPVWSASWLGTAAAPGFVTWLRPVARWAGRASPLSFAYPMEVWGPWVMTLAGRAWMIRQMVGLQVAGGLVLLVVAAWRLRPAYRAQAGGERANRLAWLARLAGLRGRSRPACGDDPMAWKERHAPESAWLARLSILAGLGLVAYIGKSLFLGDPRFRDLVFDEIFLHGLDIDASGAHFVRRSNYNYVLCEQAAILFVAALATSTILAASGVAGERGRGTWAGLLGTPLDRREILRAKMWGAVRPVRVLLGMMLFFYSVSLAMTALHPVGFAIAATAAPVFLWFAVALGTYVSLRSKGANRAIGRTVVILLAVNLAPVAALYPWIGPRSDILSTPLFMATLPLSRAQFRGLAGAIAVEPSAALLFVLAAGIVASHAVGAWLLTRAAAGRIERDEG